MTTPMPAPGTGADDIAALVARAGFRRVHMLAWRDLDDVEAGGSEIHAANVASRWAQAGLEVTMRTSYAQGRAPIVTRDGYRVIRRAGRYLVFPRAVLSEIAERHGPWDAVVEIWNGMPFFSPLWRRGRPSIVFLHHVHAEMWRMVLPENPRLARAGELLETKWAPLLYRRSRVITLSESSRSELVDDLGFRGSRVEVVPPGIDPRYSPGGERSPVPLVVAVGRLVPVKRFHLLINALGELKRRHPTLEAVIAGEGYERPLLEERRAAIGAESWLRLAGRLSDGEILDLYRRAWVLAGTSAREGWGMTATEAGACATPAVLTDVPGHRDAVVDGETGLLATGVDGMVDALDRMIRDHDLRERLGKAALVRAERFTWDATAYDTLAALVDEAERTRRRG